jgi:hypothetical protein
LRVIKCSFSGALAGKNLGFSRDPENPVAKISLTLTARYDGKILPEEIPDDVECENASVSGQEDIVSGRVLRDRYDKVLRPSFFIQSVD